MSTQPVTEAPAESRTESESPALTVGLLGFTSDEKRRIVATLAQACAGGVQWRMGAFAHADAWLVNGARAQLVGDQTLRVAPVEDAPPVRFRLPEVDRPIAFSEPLRPDIDPICRFRIDQPGSIHAVLGRFVQQLRPLVSQLCLASQLVERRPQLLWRRLYHVSARGRLLAVVDLQSHAGVLPMATPAQFVDADWAVRPPSARYIPEGFVRVTLPVLLWQYAVRTQRELLPRKYRDATIHYRRPPEVPHRLMSDRHLLLMRELAQGSRRFDELEQRMGLTAGRLARDLAAFYVTGAITANPARARAAPTAPMRFNPDATGALHLGGMESQPVPFGPVRAVVAAAR